MTPPQNECFESTNGHADLGADESGDSVPLNCARAIEVLNKRFAESEFDGQDAEKLEIAQIYDRLKRRRKEPPPDVAAGKRRTEFIVIRGSPGTGKEHLVESFLEKKISQ